MAYLGLDESMNDFHKSVFGVGVDNATMSTLASASTAASAQDIEPLTPRQQRFRRSNTLSQLGSLGSGPGNEALSTLGMDQQGWTLQQVRDLKKESDHCVVCLEPLRKSCVIDLLRLHCGHVLHCECLVPQDQPHIRIERCPVCKKEIHEHEKQIYRYEVQADGKWCQVRKIPGDQGRVSTMKGDRKGKGKGRGKEKDSMTI